jgi:hypothetical protein
MILEQGCRVGRNSPSQTGGSAMKMLSIKFKYFAIAIAVASLNACGGGGGSSSSSGSSPSSAPATSPAPTIPPSTPAKVNGSCGSASGVSRSSAPTANLCSTGTASSVVTGTNSYAWSCLGSNGGTTVQCSAPISNPTGFTPSPQTYSVPAAGQAIAIGTNTANSIKAAQISSFAWAYALFNCFGGGTFNPDYSAAGAFMIAGSGGHNCPAANVDAAVFDFSDATWKRVANANGIVPREADYDSTEITNDAYAEIRAATAGQIQTPTHEYNMPQYLPTSLGGGAKGSFLKIGGPGTTPNAGTSPGIHKMDMATGLWTRPTNDTVDFFNAAEYGVVFDPVAQRYYFIPDSFHAANNLQYYDPTTSTMKTTVAYPFPADYTASGYQVAFLDPVHRLILIQRPGFPLRALDLNNIASGWVVLSTTGTAPSENNRPAFYAPDGRFYTRGNNSGQTLIRLTPPATWKTGTWTYDTVTVTGATLPDFTTTGNSSVNYYGTFFYVPSIQTLAWISGENTNVIILKPPL